MPGAQWTDAEIRTVLHSYGVPLDELARQLPGRSPAMLAEYRNLIHRSLELQHPSLLSGPWRRAVLQALQQPGVRCPQCGLVYWG